MAELSGPYSTSTNAHGIHMELASSEFSSEDPMICLDGGYKVRRKFSNASVVISGVRINADNTNILILWLQIHRNEHVSNQQEVRLVGDGLENVHAKSSISVEGTLWLHTSTVIFRSGVSILSANVRSIWSGSSFCSVTKSTLGTSASAGASASERVYIRLPYRNIDSGSGISATLASRLVLVRFEHDRRWSSSRSESTVRFARRRPLFVSSQQHYDTCPRWLEPNLEQRKRMGAF